MFLLCPCLLQCFIFSKKSYYIDCTKWDLHNAFFAHYTIFIFLHSCNLQPTPVWWLVVRPCLFRSKNKIEFAQILPVQIDTLSVYIDRLVMFCLMMPMTNMVKNEEIEIKRFTVFYYTYASKYSTPPQSKGSFGVAEMAGFEPGSPDLQFSNPRCHVQMR